MKITPNINEILNYMLAAFAGLLSYYYYLKRNELAFTILELIVFISSAVIAAKIAVSFIPPGYEWSHAGAAGLAGLSANETTRYFSKEGVSDVTKRLVELLIDRWRK